MGASEEICEVTERTSCMSLNGFGEVSGKANEGKAAAVFGTGFAAGSTAGNKNQGVWAVCPR